MNYNAVKVTLGGTKMTEFVSSMNKKFLFQLIIIFSHLLLQGLASCGLTRVMSHVHAK